MGLLQKFYTPDQISECKKRLGVDGFSELIGKTVWMAGSPVEKTFTVIEFDPETEEFILKDDSDGFTFCTDPMRLNVKVPEGLDSSLWKRWPIILVADRKGPTCFFGTAPVGKNVIVEPMSTGGFGSPVLPFISIHFPDLCRTYFAKCYFLWDGSVRINPFFSYDMTYLAIKNDENYAELTELKIFKMWQNIYE